MAWFSTRQTKNTIIMQSAASISPPSNLILSKSNGLNFHNPFFKAWVFFFSNKTLTRRQLNFLSLLLNKCYTQFLSWVQKVRLPSNINSDKTSQESIFKTSLTLQNYYFFFIVIKEILLIKEMANWKNKKTIILVTWKLKITKQNKNEYKWECSKQNSSPWGSIQKFFMDL